MPAALPRHAWSESSHWGPRPTPNCCAVRAAVREACHIDSRILLVTSRRGIVGREKMRRLRARQRAGRAMLTTEVDLTALADFLADTGFLAPGADDRDAVARALVVALDVWCRHNAVLSVFLSTFTDNLCPFYRHKSHVVKVSETLPTQRAWREVFI